MEELPVFTLRRENGVLYFRRPIPKNLQPFLNGGNKREITVSLKSKKLTAETRRLHHQHWMDSERLLEEAEKRKNAATKGSPAKASKSAPRDSIQRRPAHAFTQSELRALVQGWFAKATAETLENARLAFNFGDVSEREAALEFNASRLASLQRRPDAVPSLEVHAVQRSLIEEAGGFIPHIMPVDDVLRLAEFEASIREGLIRLAMFEREILTTGMPPKLESVGTAMSETAPGHAPANGPSLSLDALIEKFENDPERSGIRAKTRDEFKLVFGILREILGGTTPLSTIKRERLKEVQSVCLQLPAHYRKLYPGKTLREVAKQATAAGQKPMERATFNKRMTLIAALFNYAVREQIISSSPALGLTLEESRKPAGEKSFTVDDLKRIFSGSDFLIFAENPAARYTPGNEREPHKFWAPLIGLFQGMRMEEILQLRPDDISQRDGVMSISVGGSEGQDVKTVQSVRRIPVHPVLEELGFLRFVRAAKTARLPELFPDAARGKTYGNRSHNYSKRFNRYLAEIGVKAGREQCFHSLRHTFIDGLRMAGIPLDVQRQLGGWTDTVSLSDSYGGRLLPYLKEQLSKLKFPGLDLLHLERN